MKVASEATEAGRSAFYPASGLSSTFGFKLQDKYGRMHRFNCGMLSHLELLLINRKIGQILKFGNLNFIPILVCPKISSF